MKVEVDAGRMHSDPCLCMATIQVMSRDASKKT